MFGEHGVCVCVPQAIIRPCQPRLLLTFSPLLLFSLLCGPPDLVRLDPAVQMRGCMRRSKKDKNKLTTHRGITVGFYRADR